MGNSNHYSLYVNGPEHKIRVRRGPPVPVLIHIKKIHYLLLIVFPTEKKFVFFINFICNPKHVNQISLKILLKFNLPTPRKKNHLLSLKAAVYWSLVSNKFSVLARCYQLLCEDRWPLGIVFVTGQNRHFFA